MSALDTLTGLLSRFETSPNPVRHAMWAMVQKFATEADAEMQLLEDQISAKRDWLDTHRDDPRYDKRRAKFFNEDVRLHAQYGETLERVDRALIQRAS